MNVFRPSAKRRAARRAVRVALLAPFITILMPEALAAQEERIETPYRWIEHSARVGLIGGYVFASRGDLEMGPGPAATVGVRLRTRVSSPLSLEVNAMYGSSDRFVIDPRLETGPGVADTVGLGWLALQLNIQFALTGARSLHRLQPYVVLGAGLLLGLDQEKSDIFVDPPDSDLRFDLGTAPILTLGVGTELDISDGLGLGLEIRDLLWRFKAPDGFFGLDILQLFQDAEVGAPQESSWAHNFEFSAGLFYYF
jgi:hypothetical protein